MIWLDICDDQGNSIYFDIYHIERRRRGRRWQHAVNGVCGNGLFEVEVLVEPGENSAVTFFDLSIGAASGHQLLSGIDQSQLETGLIGAARELCGLMKPPFLEAQRFYPHPARILRPSVNENTPSWQTVV